jgi:hypothetical protein
MALFSNFRERGNAFGDQSARISLQPEHQGVSPAASGPSTTWRPSLPSRLAASSARADRYRSGSAVLEAGLLFGSPLPHPTILARRDLLERSRSRHDAAHWVAEDCEPWARLARFTEMANLPQVLLHQGTHPGCVSHVQRPRQEAAARRVRGDLLGRAAAGRCEQRGPRHPRHGHPRHGHPRHGHPREGRAGLRHGRGAGSRAGLPRGCRGLAVAGRQANRRSHCFDRAGLAHLIQKHWYEICRNLWLATRASAVRGRFSPRPWARPAGGSAGAPTVQHGPCSGQHLARINGGPAEACISAAPAGARRTERLTKIGDRQNRLAVRRWRPNGKRPRTIMSNLICNPAVSSPRPATAAGRRSRRPLLPRVPPRGPGAGRSRIARIARRQGWLDPAG